MSKGGNEFYQVVGGLGGLMAGSWVTGELGGGMVVWVLAWLVSGCAIYAVTRFWFTTVWRWGPAWPFPERVESKRNDEASKLKRAGLKRLRVESGLPYAKIQELLVESGGDERELELLIAREKKRKDAS